MSNNSGHTPPSDPFQSPCQCHFRSRCLDQGWNHPLSTHTIRAANYDAACIMYFNNPNYNPKDCAVDHIIELQQVKHAIYRASRIFELWTDVHDWLEDFENKHPDQKEIFQGHPDTKSEQSSEDFRKRLFWPRTVLQTCAFLEEVKMIFNNTNNLCSIDETFNSTKNHWLSASTASEATLYELAPSIKMGERLRAYYEYTRPLHNTIMDYLKQQFWNTGNAMFWAIERLLQEEMTAIRQECKTYPIDKGEWVLQRIWIKSDTIDQPGAGTRKKTKPYPQTEQARALVFNTQNPEKKKIFHKTTAPYPPVVQKPMTQAALQKKADYQKKYRARKQLKVEAARAGESQAAAGGPKRSPPNKFPEDTIDESDEDDNPLQFALAGVDQSIPSTMRWQSPNLLTLNTSSKGGLFASNPLYRNMYTASPRSDRLTYQSSLGYDQPLAGMSGLNLGGEDSGLYGFYHQNNAFGRDGGNENPIDFNQFNLSQSNASQYDNGQWDSD